MSKQKYYVVWKGNTPGVYRSWEECKKQIEGFTAAVYKSFKDKNLAEKAFTEGSENYIGIDERILSFTEEQKKIIGEPIANSISVDAACSGNPGILEYRGVFTSTGREIFRQGPFPEGTVNLGEFLALIHGLAYLKQKNSNRPVYTDSKTAMSWVRNRKIKTKLIRSRKNEKLFQLVDRAITWLKKNEYPNEILKWKT
ncbi:MAG: ribonuclease H, partial [Bacteroidetes bacterium 4484_249]